MEIVKLIECFLQLNPEPTDQQVHALAMSINMDVAELEAQMYRMLGQYSKVEARVLARLEASTQFEKVLRDELPEAQTPKNLLTLNDGTTDPTSSQSIQDLTNNDGSPDTDNVQSLLLDDGVLDIG